jgi:type II secretory pathway component PulJ
LASQAATLDTLFHHLTQLAFRDPRTTDEFSAYLKLALRAQAQSANALAAVAEIKQGPRVVVAKQLNAAHQQVVNNVVEGASRPARRKSVSPRPALLSESSPLPDYAQMDTRSPREAAPAHQPVEAVGEVHRPAE